MCCCGKPTKNGEPGAYSWDGKTFMTRPPDPPAIKEGDTVLFDEPGRCGGIDSHCHHFIVVRREFGGLSLLVRHGGGDERMDYLFANDKAIEKALTALDSDGRYWMMCVIYHAANKAHTKGRELEYQKWLKAAAEKRIKTRKVKSGVKVWIENPVQ